MGSGATGSSVGGGADDLGIPDDLGSADNAPAAPRQRPRITEHGPVLPEDLGSPGETTYDMTQGGGGPMGLGEGQVSQGLNPLLNRLSVCADATTDDDGHGPHGRVSVRLRIHNNGTPVAARVSGGSGGGADFTMCVRRVIASARFASFNGPDAFATWGFDVD